MLDLAWPPQSALTREEHCNLHLRGAVMSLQLPETDSW